MTTPRSICIGSLPFRNASDALVFLDRHPEILPFVPELPNASIQEHSLSRAEHYLSERPVDLSQSYRCLTAMHERIRRDGMRYPLIKCQLLGPYTLSKYAASNPSAVEAKTAVRRQLQHLIPVLSEIGSHVVVQFDEPALPCQRAPQPGEVGHLLELTEFVRSQGCMVGLHSCHRDATSLLTLPFDLLLLDLSSADATSCVDLKLQASVLGVGVFPSTERDESLDVAEKKYLQWQERFPDTLLLRSATCGHASASTQYLDQLYSRHL